VTKHRLGMNAVVKIETNRKRHREGLEKDSATGKYLKDTRTSREVLKEAGVKPEELADLRKAIANF